MPIPTLNLPDVTLICADGIDAERAAVILQKSKSKCNFGAIKLLTALPIEYEHRVAIRPLLSHLDYSVFMFKTAHEYVDTSHVLVTQHDAWVLNPESWNPAWLNYDYIGPLFIQQSITGPTSVGSGGFSLRSKRLMKFASDLLPAWTNDYTGTQYHHKHMGCYEDGKISMHFRERLTVAGFKFAPPEEASKFAQGGNCNPAYYVERPFGFHGFWHNMNRDTGFVSPWPWPSPY